MDRFSAMGAFVRVVEAGSFTKAADGMRLPKATVTRLVQGLERALQVRLLQRTTRSVTVTAEGAAYYERVVALLSELSDIETATRQTLAKPSGRLRVDMSTSIARAVVIPALPAFHREYPDIHLEFGVGNKITDLAAENVDCALRVGEVSEPSLVSRRIGEFDVLTGAAPGYLAEHGTPGSAAELDGHQLVGLISTRTAKPLPFRFARNGESLELTPLARFAVNDTNAYVSAGIAGLGLVQAPAFMLDTPIAAGRLVQVLSDWRTAPAPVHIVYRPNRFLGAKVRVFIDWIISLFEGHPSIRTR
jgi:DNA-binding transcriptional LysR family regulator